MNFSNDWWRLDEELVFLIMDIINAKLSIALDEEGYALLFRTHVSEFQNMMLMGAEMG